jgi:hypothetical protein
VPPSAEKINLNTVRAINVTVVAGSAVRELRRGAKELTEVHRNFI